MQGDARRQKAKSRTGEPAPAFDRRTPLAELPQWLTVDEVGAYLKIRRALAYDLARACGVRVGRLLRVPREALATEALAALGRKA